MHQRLSLSLPPTPRCSIASPFLADTIEYPDSGVRERCDRLGTSFRDANALKEELVGYAVGIVRRTRTHDAILVGASPRATESLLLASRAAAAIDDRDYVTPDDIKSLARASLAHRILLRPEYEIEGLTCEEAVDLVLQEEAVPR